MRAAEVLLARGDAAQAAAAALGAVADAARAGARRDEAVARLLAGRALAAAGDAERAKASCAMSPTTPAAAARTRSSARPRASCAASARASPGRTPRRRASGPDALSERERDVSELVVQGRSNKEVAAELFLSEKTIESTLTRIYAKLGVRSRVELTRRLTPARDGTGIPPVRIARARRLAHT